MVAPLSITWCLDTLHFFVIPTFNLQLVKLCIPRYLFKHLQFEDALPWSGLDDMMPSGVMFLL